MKKYLAIDPGWGGAVSYYIPEKKALGLSKCPGDAAGIIDFLSTLMDKYGREEWLVGMENNHSSPTFGARGNFGLGLNIGSWETALASAGMRIVVISPKEWQKSITQERSSVKKGRKMWKEKSWRYARKCFPSFREQLGATPPSPRNFRQGYADALCILEYLRREY